ncbi:MAG: Bro-N domain-containing protein [Holophagales bacterium]|jgi:hypothetical protein|nr:Bro-N domain-containing protein [Holophagales bacterium]
MSKNKDKVKLFEDKQVRAIWDEEAEKWWFSVVDIIAVLTDGDYQTARKYWKVLKGRLAAEGNESVTNCYQLKMKSTDGKMYLTDTADTEQVLRLVQSVPSKKAEPFKLWLAKAGSERIDETIDPELSIARAIQGYRRLGYSENWINQRIKSIEVRKGLTDEWDRAGVGQAKECAALTDLMSRTWSGMTTREYKRHKGLKKENLRDNMTNTELVLNMLAEVAATDISIARQPSGFVESAAAAEDGAKAAKAAREQIEKSTGKPAVSRLSAKDLDRLRLGAAKGGERE